MNGWRNRNKPMQILR